MEDLAVDGRVILKCMLNKIGSSGKESYSSNWRRLAGCLEHGSEPSGSVKCGEFLDWLRNY